MSNEGKNKFFQFISPLFIQIIPDLSFPQHLFNNLINHPSTLFYICHHTSMAKFHLFPYTRTQTISTY